MRIQVAATGSEIQCSVRTGNYGEIDFYVAELVDGSWTNWQNAGQQLNGELSIGELHLLSDEEMYFHWNGAGGFGVSVTETSLFSET